MKLIQLKTELYQNDRGNVKCDNCNNQTDIFNIIANDKSEAINLLKEGEAGLCDDCITNVISSNYNLYFRDRLNKVK